MAYIIPIHPPSSIRHALKLNFLTPDEECLVVAKSNRLDFWRQAAEGLVLEHSSAIYGKVTMLERISGSSSKKTTDHLFVGTDRYAYFTVSWDARRKRLRTEHSAVDSSEIGARDAQLGEKSLIDPTGRFIALELFEGIVTVVPVSPPSSSSSSSSSAGKKAAGSAGGLGMPMPARIPELFVRSSAFLHGYRQRPRLALLFEDGQRRVHVKVKELVHTPGSASDSGQVELNDAEVRLSNLEDHGASHIIPVEGSEIAFLVLGETSIIGVDNDCKVVCTEQLAEPTIFVAWEALSKDRFVLADDFGHLHHFQIFWDTNNRSFDIKVLMRTSRASTLVSLGNGFVFVGSHQGDSQVVRIDVDTSEVQVVQTIPNIAPILDFTVMDMGNRGEEGQTNEYSSGQARIVTGSGAFDDGSLRSVRSGVGLEELGILGDIHGIRDMFSLKSNGAQQYVDTLVASFAGETRVFQFGGEGEVEEVAEFKALELSESTIVAANIPNDQIIQVTASSARVVDAEGGTVLSEWKPSSGQTITDAAANDEKVLLSVDGISLVVLDIRNGLAAVTEKTFDPQSQIACLALPGPSSTICIAGFWQSATITVFKLDTLEELTTETVGDEKGISVPRTILMSQVLADQPPTLFVGMADGIIFTFSVNTSDFSLSSKKSMVLGTQQASFRPLLRPDGLTNVFTICEHPSLIYGSEGKLVYSAVTADAATCVCPFDTELYPGSIIVSTADDLKIATVDIKRATHVRSLPVGETVRRVAYSPKLRAFGLGTIARFVEEGTEVVKSHVKLVDEVLFGLLDTYDLNTDELVECAIRAELDSGGGAREKFIVGTGYLDDESDEAIRGRILVFEVTEDRKLSLVAEQHVKGACRCLSILDGNIVAALIKTVVIYAFDRNSGDSSLIKRATYRTSTAPIDLAVTGNSIAIADLMKSVSIVEFQRGQKGVPDTLTEVSRHFQTTWGTAVANVAEDTYLESDAEGNLMVLHQNRNGVTEEDRRRLEVTSDMLLGEMVNRIRRITIPANANATVIPRAFLATVEGAIYLFALIAPNKQDLLMRLQASMATRVQSPGNMQFNKYRGFRNTSRQSDEPFRFVDGELIERFLDCEDALQEEIVEGLSVDLEEIRSLVEGLKRLH
ncbi:MAG: hypothetical protein M4579_004935 [Chaenotheca gracillima]|nr:MAG: hypothetical protein M4579_004935 [Chaenotheca gracillima]